MDYTHLLGLQRSYDPGLDYEYQGHEAIAYFMEISSAGYHDYTFCAVWEEEGWSWNSGQVQAQLYF